MSAAPPPGVEAAPVPGLTDEELERAAHGPDPAAALGPRLAGLLERLRELAATGEPGPALMAEVMSLYNAAAHVLLYLDEIGATDALAALAPLRARLHEDPELDARLAALLAATECREEDAERARREHLGQLRDAGRRAAADRELAARLTALHRARAGLLAARRALLARLGVPDAARPDDALRALLARVPSPATRTKLGRAWRGTAAAHLAPLVEAYDGVVAARRAAARQAGFPSPLARTLGPTGPAPEVVETFLADHLRHGLAARDALEAELRAEAGPSAEVDDHLDLLLGARSPKAPRLAADDCLERACRLLGPAFGLELAVTHGPFRPFPALRASRDGRPVGLVYVDVWDAPHKAHAAHHTTGVRNRTDWPGLTQPPVAFVSCRFPRDADGGRAITLGNARSLLHELGHALHQLLLAGRLPFGSGIEYLPPHAREALPAWCEGWVHHDAFTGATEAVRWARWRLSCEFRRGALERAAVAWLDFAVHRAEHGGLGEALERLEDRFGVLARCEAPALVVSLTQAAHVEVAGGTFMYPWGRALGAAAFAATTGPEGPLPGAAAEALRPCLTPGAPSRVPSVDALFAPHAAGTLAGPEPR